MTAGLDSLGAVSVRSNLVRRLRVDVSATIVFDYPTISEIASHISACKQDPEAACGPPSSSLTGRPYKHELTQLVNGAAGRWDGEPLYRDNGRGILFRRTDNMECVRVPAARVWVGDGRDGRQALANEQPCHEVQVDSFLVDVEPVCVGAFARFLNLVQPSAEQLADWYTLRADDARLVHLPLELAGDVWRPRAQVPEEWPMFMVSWYGANAYSLWANGRDWRAYRAASTSFLPTEAQWEYAARGRLPVNFPWGNGPAAPGLANVCWDEAALDPEVPVGALPMVAVGLELGMSVFGLRHMAGNVWQWCRDAYDPHFYSTREAGLANAWDRTEDGPRSERGGSWVGPARFARCSYRRGRAPAAKGRCLGFRCVGLPGDAPAV